MGSCHFLNDVRQTGLEGRTWHHLLFFMTSAELKKHRQIPPPGKCTRDIDDGIIYKNVYYVYYSEL